MYFRFNLLVYRFDKKIVEKMNIQTNGNKSIVSYTEVVSR
jgi:hypothetical protein